MPTRSLALAMLIALVPALAHAHPCPRTDDTSTLTPAATEDARRLELASIDSESHSATALYVASLSLVLTGIGIGAGATGASVRCIGSWSPCSSGEWAPVLAITSSALLVLGVIALPIAIGLDVDSGSRRGGWQSRAVTIDTVQLGPTEGGAFVSLVGRF